MTHNSVNRYGHNGRPAPVRRRRLAGVVLLAVALAGCSTTPTFERPGVPEPERWDSPATATSTGAASTNAQWWKRFNSLELDALMAQALATNHDIAASVQRIEQARASLVSARSALLPAVQGSTGTSASRSRSNGRSASSEDAQAGLTVSYEVDLFGGNAAAGDAASANLMARRFDRESVLLLVQSELATAYFQALAYQDRLQIARDNLTTGEELLRLVQVRVDNGAAAALDLAQQRTTLLAIQAEIPSLQQSLKETLHAIAVLLGRAPQGFAIEGTSLASLTLPQVDAAPPPSLLERRPDIRASEARLMAANADIGAARAALYPSLSLSASAGVSGLLSGGSTVLAQLAASLAQTLFDGGRRQATVDLREATHRELVEQYIHSVLVGYQEVENSLSAIDGEATRADLLARAQDQARESWRLARIRYDNGAYDLLTLLDSQRSVLSAGDALVQAHLRRYVATVNLFKALGGGWSDESVISTGALADGQGSGAAVPGA